jgi:hypothetical protein
MPNVPLNRIGSDAQSLADRVGTQTAEALIRAISGVQQSASGQLETARAGAAVAGEQVGQITRGVAEGVQSVALPSPSARLAWRAGRLVGRIEGAVRLAAFGVRFWWRRRQREPQGEHRQGSTRALVVLMQWGPSAVASVYLMTQLWSRARRRVGRQPNRGRGLR